MSFDHSMVAAVHDVRRDTRLFVLHHPYALSGALAASLTWMALTFL
jgi:hypothetical protein